VTRRGKKQVQRERELLRADYLGVLGDVLWPGCDVRLEAGRRRRQSRSNPVAATYLVVPGVGRPRLLVASGARAAAATAARQMGDTGSPLKRLRQTLLALLLRTPADRVFRHRIVVRAPVGRPEQAVEAHLRDVVPGGADLVCALLVPAAKANRKPVIHLISRTGRSVGFAKLSVDPLTDRLVDAESAALGRLAGIDVAEVEVPSLVHAGPWSGRRLLVQSALPLREPRVRPDPDRRSRAMAAIARSLGVVHEPLARSRYLARLQQRIDELPASADSAALAAALGRLRTESPDLEIEFGLWHGDWSPWNMAWLVDRLLVWDWERLECGVPIGFDALHHHWQARLARDRDRPRSAIAEMRSIAPQLLSAMGVPGPAATVVARLYTIHFAVRYLADGQAEAGSRAGPLGDWLLPELLPSTGGEI
jgi:hypothetical protein